MKILVLGTKGQLGRCLKDQLDNTDHKVIYSSREHIDIAEFEIAKKKILDFLPDIIINATAYTAVDKAEDEQEKADLINHLAVRNIANIANQICCWLIHISTDYVFDGNSSIPYKELDNTNPKGVYGKTKLKGELAIQASNCRHIIIRTSWLYSEYGNNFLKTMLRLGKERDELSIVEDQIGCPTYAQDIASCIIKIIPKLNSNLHNGLYHYCGDQPCSWYEFAKFIFEEAKNHGKKIPRSLHAIKSSEYLAAVERPKYSVLECKKIYENFGVTPSNWKNSISNIFKIAKL
jgi:dTDP-4-dehydrorhamnose reductase